MTAPADHDDEKWLAARVALQRPVDGRDRTGGDRLVVNAQVLRDCVLTARRPAGVRVSGLKILGGLDLAYAEIQGPIAITDSEFTNDIDCSNAKCVSLDLTGSSFPSLDCDGARCQHDMVLMRVNVDLVVLQDAEVGGSLVLSDATFKNRDGVAVQADRLRVAGGVFIRNKFSATGEIRLLGAIIAGPLDLSGGTVSNPGGAALSAEGAEIRGGVFCSDGFSATGEVRMVDATIGGQLSLSGGQFSHPDGNALSINRAKIGNLHFTETSIETSGDCSLVGAHIGYLQDRPAAWLAFDKIQLLDLTYDRINHAHWTTKQRLEWLQKDDTHQNQPYEQFATISRAQGDERRARKVLIAKHTRQWLAQPWYTRLPGLLFGGLLGYGYRPLQRTVPLLLALYLLGAFWLLPQARDHHAVIATRVPVHTTTTAASAQNGQPLQPIVATMHCPADYPCFSSWAYTLDVLVPLVNTHQTDYWTVISRPGDRGAIWYIRLAPMLGWILSTAAALGFTGLIRRES